MPIHNLMEDAATAEISRAQIWQWIRHPKGVLHDGRKVTVELFQAIFGEETTKIGRSQGRRKESGRSLRRPAGCWNELSTSEEFPDFLTLPAYEYL